MTGFVYFIACGDRVKIGYSADPARRLVKINSDAPWPCELLGFVLATEFPEAELHARFAHLRLHGEWFALSPEVREFIAAASIMTSPAARQKSGLEPAASIIERLGGVEEVARITGVHLTRVYGWKRPKGPGGTGGLIPFKRALMLLGAARDRGIQLTANDFMPSKARAA